MKDNKDEEKTLFQAIDAVDDKFLMETLKDMEKRKNQNHKQQLKFKQMTPMVKAATIALICFLTLGISVSVAAATSKTFRQWIQKTFMSQTIYKVTQTKDVSDHKKNQKIVLKDNMEIKQGHNQSFICQYHYEGKYDVEVTDKVYTIEGNHLKELKPDSLTVHTLAIKKASTLINDSQGALDKLRTYNIEDFMKISADAADYLGMKPYYLYRQKNMLSNLENIGYALEDKISLYNIAIMEEKQTIIAFGSGSVSKFTYPEENRIERVSNIKDVKLYIDNVEQVIAKKNKEVEKWI